MEVQRATFRGAGGDELAALFALPESLPAAAPRSAVLVVHDASGLDDAARAAVRRLVEAGHAVLAPDLLSRGGAPAEAAASGPARLADRRVLADLDAALAELAGRTGLGDDALGVLGLGAGGTFALLFGCHSDRVGAVVDLDGPVVYPELSPARPMQPLEMALNLGAPLLGLFAGADPAVPREHVEALERQLAQFMKRARIQVLEGVRPGFAGEVATAATGGAWELVLEFLGEELG